MLAMFFSVESLSPDIKITNQMIICEIFKLPTLLNSILHYGRGGGAALYFREGLIERRGMVLN